MKNAAKCEVCGVGHLDVSTEEREVEFAGKAGQIEFELSVCDTCGTEQTTTEQSRANKRAMIALKRQRREVGDE